MKLWLVTSVPIVISAGSMVLSWTRIAEDRSERLNAPLDYQDFTGDVDSFRVSPDGRWAVYRAQQDHPVAGLYVTRTDVHTVPMLISEPGVAVGEFQLSSTGLQVVYLTASGLIKVGANGVRVQLNPALVSGGSILSFQISPDGQRVVYLADQDTDQVSQVYSVPITGAASPVPLSPPPGAASFLVSNDSARVVFHGSGGLFSVPIDGSAPALPLCGSFVPGGGVSHPVLGGDPNSYYRISPDSQRVVYMADQLVDEQVELFSVPIDQSASPVRLNPAPVSGGDVQVFKISADSLRVVYLADQDVNDTVELFSAPLDGSAQPIQLSQTELLRAFVNDFVLSPTGSEVAYRGRPAGSNSGQLFRVPIDGSLPALQLSDLTPNWAEVVDLSFAPDSSRVLYRAYVGGDQSAELFSVPLDGSSAPAQLNPTPPLSTLSNVTNYRITPGGYEVVYRGVGTQAGLFELFRAPVDGSSAAVPLGAAGRIVEADFALSGASVYARCALEIDGVVELCAMPLDAGEPPTRLNGPLLSAPAVTDVIGFALAPDGKWVAYGTGKGAFGVPLGGSETARALTPPGWRSVCTDLGVSADSTRAFYESLSVTRAALFSAPIDGSSSARELSSLGYGGGYVEAPDGSRLAFTVSPYEGPSGLLTIPPDGSGSATFLGAVSGRFSFTTDGTRIVFGEPRDFFASTRRLVIRAADGSSPPIELAPNSPSDEQTVLQFRVTPDGTRVVFTCNLELASKFELFSIPSDGSMPPTKISGSLAGRVVDGFFLTPDGQHAVYAADRDAPGVIELYVAPIDGSSAPLELSAPLVTGGDVALAASAPLIQITPDSSRVVYVADQEVDQRFELYSVPLDASSPPVKLNPTLVSGGDVYVSPDSVRLSRDGARVVYLADQTLDERFELYSVSISGGPAAALSGTLASNRDVRPGFVILQHSDAVVFLSDRALNERFELWLAPLHGRARPTACSFLGHAAASVAPDFRLAPDEEYVYYRADALEDERVELFRFPLVRVPRHARR